MKRTYSLMVLLLLSVNHCGVDTPRTALPEPLTWMYLGMPKEDLIPQLPASQSTMHDHEHTTSLVAIQDQHYIDHSVQSINLYYKDHNGERILRAAYIIYTHTDETQGRLLAYLEASEMDSNDGFQWIKEGRMRATLDTLTPGFIKFIVELRE